MNDNALGFILRTKFKNYFKELLHKPGRLVLMIIIVLLLGVTLLYGIMGSEGRDTYFRSINEIYAIINVLFVFVFCATFLSALEKGGSIFKMSDVNLLFPAPFSKRSVLFFGLIQQLGTVLFIGIFILFQYGNLRIHYGLGVGAMLLIMLGYSAVVFIAQTAAMFLYMFVSDSDSRKKRAKLCFYLLIALFAAIAALTVFPGRGFTLAAFTDFGNSLVLRLFPFAGWLGAFTSALLSGEYIIAALWLLLTALSFAAIVIAMARSSREYYEDVLDSATATFNAMSTAKDGLAPEAVPKNIKLGKTGLGKGVGASVIYYKHLIENRRAQVFLLSNMSLLFVAMTVGFSFFMRNNGIIPVLSFSVYCGIFTLGTGRFARELTKPFVYLIPEPPVKKLLYTMADTLPSLLVESLITFIPVAFIVGASPLECILCAVAKTSFGILFLSGSLIIDRLWGGSLSKIVGVLIYFLFDIILAIPGVLVAAVSVNVFLPGAELPIAFLSLSAVNLLISLLVFFCCRNVLQYSEI